MATSKVSKSIGVIAEDRSDVDVVSALFEKYVPKSNFTVRHFVGNGCGKLKNKCRTWTETLFQLGCEHVFLFHDLDRQIEAELRKLLEERIPKLEFPTALIVIPIEEMEAWLLSDIEAIKAVFAMKAKLKRYKNCEAVNSPKEEIGRLAWNTNKKRYLNTVHNKRIAEKVSLDNLRRCPSYLPFDAYLKKNVFAT
jgi:hypothetical protein